MDAVSLHSPDTNRPGIGGTILLAEIKHITAFGAPAAVTVLGDELRITGDHTFEAGKGFVEWETEDDIANLKIPVTGSRASLGLKPELTIFLPGLTAEQAVSAVQNKRFIGLVKAFGCNSIQHLQLGDDCNPLRLMPSDGFSSGVAGGNDARGWTFKLGCNYSVAFYEGDVLMYGDTPSGQ